EPTGLVAPTGTTRMTARNSSDMTVHHRCLPTTHPPLKATGLRLSVCTPHPLSLSRGRGESSWARPSPLIPLPSGEGHTVGRVRAPTCRGALSESSPAQCCDLSQTSSVPLECNRHPYSSRGEQSKCSVVPRPTAEVLYEAPHSARAVRRAGVVCYLAKASRTSPGGAFKWPWPIGLQSTAAHPCAAPRFYQDGRAAC